MERDVADAVNDRDERDRCPRWCGLDCGERHAVRSDWRDHLPPAGRPELLVRRLRLYDVSARPLASCEWQLGSRGLGERWSSHRWHASHRGGHEWSEYRGLVGRSATDSVSKF